MLAKLKKELAQVEARLEKHRTACAEIHGNGTMRKARHEINWDYYAQQKFKLKGQIEELEQQEAEEKTREQLFCNSCLAMFEEECCCNENE
jgi:hypothetical protein